MFAASKTAKAASAAAATDPQFPYVTMLLHGDGTNGAQNNTFVDSSTNNFTITRNGNTTQGTFTPYGSNWSNYFDGSGDYLSVADANALDFAGDFTVECWFYLTGSLGSDRAVLHKSDTNVGWELVITSGNKVSGNCTSLTIASTTSIVANTWYHAALVRNGSGTNNVKLYLNGVQENQGTNTTDTASTVTLGIGAVARSGAAGVNPFPGYISNVRTVASAVYTSAFTPSTTPLTAITNTSLLTCQSNRFIDNSTNNFTITKNGDTSVQRFSPFSPTTAYSTSVIGGSGYFDGNGDYLTAANNAAFNLSSGNWTIEGWVYRTASSQMVLFSKDHYSGVFYPQYQLSINASSFLELNLGTGGVTPSTAYTGSTTIPLNQWTHICAVKSGANTLGFVNGVQQWNTAAASMADTGLPLYVCGIYNAGATGTGYITDARIVKGTAVYTSAFTPPTAPLTAVSGTSILLNTTNAGILDNAEMNDLETVGNAQISTSVKKYGTGSMYFDGTGDYLTAPSNAYFAIGATEDYTVECWVNFIVVQTCGFYQATNNITSATGQFWFGYEGGQLKASQHGSGTYAVGYTWSPSTSTWYHVAATRASGTVRLFINGTVVTTNTTTQNGVSFTQSGAAVGVLTTPSYLNGYIDDLRITKGVARYTANFTPPTAAFPNN